MGGGGGGGLSQLRKNCKHMAQWLLLLLSLVLLLAPARWFILPRAATELLSPYFFATPPLAAFTPPVLSSMCVCVCIVQICLVIVFVFALAAVCPHLPSVLYPSLLLLLLLPLSLPLPRFLPHLLR